MLSLAVICQMLHVAFCVCLHVCFHDIAKRIRKMKKKKKKRFSVRAAAVGQTW